MVNVAFHTGGLGPSICDDPLISGLTLCTERPIAAFKTSSGAFLTVTRKSDVVEVIAFLALGILALNGAVLTVWLDTSLAEVLGIQVEALLTRITLVHTFTSFTGTRARITLGGQLVGPKSRRTGVLARAVLKEKA